jgi:SAM-dependent methyltransferase
MTPAPDPNRFFDSFPEFGETSKTGPSLARINARYRVLLHDQRDLLADARVLDLASHDGRFSLAALLTGAREVVGIEHDVQLVDAAAAHMRAHGIDPGRYRFVRRDLFESFMDLGHFDVVFCFGILYHVNDHLHLLSNIAEVEPQTVIIDGHVSSLDGAVIELRTPLGESPPPPGTQLEGWPSPLAVEALTSTLGWSGRWIDWTSAARPDDDGIGDYLSGKRVSYVATCPDPIPPETRDLAVGLVFEAQQEPRFQWQAITGIAKHFGINPQALRMWVRKAEREARDQPKAGPNPDPS